MHNNYVYDTFSAFHKSSKADCHTKDATYHQKCELLHVWRPFKKINEVHAGAKSHEGVPVKQSNFLHVYAVEIMVSSTVH